LRIKMILPGGERPRAMRDLEAPVPHYQLPPTSGALALSPLTVTPPAVHKHRRFCLAFTTALA
jgi:hypothetical protein